MITDKKLLEHLLNHLETQNYTCFMLPKEQTGLPIDVLSIQLNNDYKQREQFLSLSFYPLKKQESNIRYLQLFVQLDMNLTDTSLLNTTFILPYINTQLPLGHFGLNMEELKIYFKFIHIFGNENKLDVKVIQDNIEMTQYILQSLGNIFRQIEEEAMDFEKLLEYFQKQVKL